MAEPAVWGSRMNPKCPACRSDSWKVGFSKGGFQCYKCKSCGKKFNERAATPFHWLHFPNKAVIMAIMLYRKYRLSSYQVENILRFNGVKASARSIMRWPQRFSFLMGKIFEEYRIELLKASPVKQAKSGKRGWTCTIELSASKGKVVARYLVPKQCVEQIAAALKLRMGS